MNTIFNVDKLKEIPIEQIVILLQNTFKQLSDISITNRIDNKLEQLDTQCKTIEQVMFFIDKTVNKEKLNKNDRELLHLLFRFCLPYQLDTQRGFLNREYQPLFFPIYGFEGNQISDTYNFWKIDFQIKSSKCLYGDMSNPDNNKKFDLEDWKNYKSKLLLL